MFILLYITYTYNENTNKEIINNYFSFFLNIYYHYYIIQLYIQCERNHHLIKEYIKRKTYIKSAEFLRKYQTN